MRRLSVATVLAVACLVLVHTPRETLSDCNHRPDGEGVRCERVPVEACRQAGYENTSVPTPLYITPTLSTGELNYNHLEPLLYLKCAQYVPVGEFICVAAFPICVPALFQRIGPCREFCVAVRESCTQDLADWGLEWPSALDCNQYAPYGSEICVWDGTSGPLCDDDGTPPPPITIPQITDPSPSTTSEVTASVQSQTTCPTELVAYPNGSGVEFGGVDNCGETCYGAYFDQDQQDFALVWITTWSLVCLLVSVICFLTYILNFRRIQSPESPIYYLSLCYAFLALTYTISIAVGRESLFCDTDFSSGKNESALITDGFEVPLCAVIFSILYYFSMCTWAWWAVLATEWFLCTVKLSSINYKLKVCSHTVGWGLPLVFLFTALPLELFSGEPVLRTCWISKGYEVWFLVGPMLVLMLYSCVVIVVTFGRIVHLQRRSKLVNISRENSMKLGTLIRVGLYVTVYLLPMGLLFGCYWYQYSFRADWEEWVVECSTSDCSQDRGPRFSVYMLQFAVSEVMGVLTGLWVIANKSSFFAWKRALCVCYDRKSPALPDATFVRHIECENHSPLAFTESSV